MPVQTRSTRVKASAIFDSDNIPVKACSLNEKATSNLSGRVGVDKPLQGSSINHENYYYKILKFINKSKFTNVQMLIMKVIRDSYTNITVNINVLYVFI